MISWKSYLRTVSDCEVICEKKEDQSEGFYYCGLFQYNNSTVDFIQYPVLALKIRAIEKNGLRKRLAFTAMKIEITLVKLVGNSDVRKIPLEFNCYWNGRENWIYVRREQFSLPLMREREYRFLSRVRITGEIPFFIEEIRFQHAEQLYVKAQTVCRSANPNEAVEWTVSVTNEGHEPHVAVIRYADTGWTETKISLSSNALYLAPNESGSIIVTGEITDKLAPGGYEKLKLYLFGEGRSDKIQEMTLWAGRSMPHPHGVFDCKLLTEIREKIKICDWAAKAYEKACTEAKAWKVPKIDPQKDYLFETINAHQARDCAIIYQLSQKEEFAEKAAAFLKEWSDPVRGYLRLPRAGNQELVHDGEFFKSAATAYDLIYDWNGWTKEDRDNLERTMRYYMDYIDVEIRSGEASNWLLAEITGAICSAAVLEDKERLERFLYGPGGASDQLARGVFDDGWWFEASIGYNLMCAGLLSEISLVTEKFGIDFANSKVSPAFRQTNCVEDARFDGLVNDAWGPNRRNYRSIDMLWDSLIPFYDNRGVIMGINDSAEQKSNAQTKAFYKLDYELAYRLYRKPEYAYMISRLQDEERNVIFGERNRPETVSQSGLQPYERSCRAENAGLIVLRSQKAGRPIREQLQVGIKSGSHGGAHGHYDRTGMIGLMRYGKSLINPENIWYSYHTFMYKFYCQTSVNHNMLTVDFKQQEAVNPKSLLFYSGQMLQVFGSENKGRWSYAPYGGWPVGRQKTIEERQWQEGRYFPIPSNHPGYAVRSGFTETILTRRVTVVTDDYVVNFDYAKSVQPHQFQCLYHLQGLRNMDGNIVFERHTEQLSSDPLGSAQFITDCNWYRTSGTVRLGFEAEYTKTWNNCWKSDWKWQNRTAYNEYGKVYTNLYYIQSEGTNGSLAAAYPPEFALVNKRLQWQVSGSDAQGAEKILAKGAFGAWILGKERIEVSLSGISQLTLQVFADNGTQGDLNEYESLNTIFWGDPVITASDGQTFDWKDLEYTSENTNPGYGPGRDYEGDRVTIQAESFDKAIPAEPADRRKAGRILLDLEQLRKKGAEPAKFSAVIGGDYPVGSADRKRRTVLQEQEGCEAHFITLLEPYEKKREVMSVRQTGVWEIEVELADGRWQKLKLLGMEDENASEENAVLSVTIREYGRNGLLREERSQRE